MPELPTALPDPKDPDACAAYYLVHDKKLAELRSWLATSTRTLGSELKTRKVIETPYGSYGEIPDLSTWEYSVEIGDRYPEYEFARQHISLIVDTPEEEQTIHSIILETVTKNLGEKVRNTWKVVTELDKTRIKKFIAESQDTETVAAIKEMRRRPKTKGRV